VSWHSYPPATNVNAVYALYFLHLYIYKRVSPNAARASEQPMVTVFSMDAGSSREGFTSCFISSWTQEGKDDRTMISSATRHPVSATASVI